MSFCAAPVSRCLGTLLLSALLFLAIAVHGSRVAYADDGAAGQSAAADAATAQNTTAEAPVAPRKLDRLQSIGRQIEAKLAEREELRNALEGSDPETMQDERERLQVIKEDLAKLRASFELVILGDLDTTVMQDAGPAEFNWREELVDVVQPLLGFLKSLTARPRQIAELRETIDVETARLEVAEKALEAIEVVPEASLDAVAARRLADTRNKWADQKSSLGESLVLAKTQLDRLENNEQSFLASVWDGLKSFLAGRGLTLMIAISAAVLAWGFMRLCWHVFHNHLTTRSVRRKATWYRLLSYSFHLLTLAVVVSTVLTVLYLRQDVLLLALSFVVIAGAVVSLRTFLPRFLREVRFLVNLGAVREDEVVIYAGLPWQVMSLNILTVLRNPALDGILRLPLEVMTELVSRPVREEIWFPSQRGDFVLLPDGTFAEVRRQTPELIELSVRGGMSMTIPTAEFYAMSLMNLSRHDTYGVIVKFGLDYSLQGASLDEIPEALGYAVRTRLTRAGFENDIVGVLAELLSAGASSLDFLVFTTVNSRRAGDYYTVERVVQQACVEVANQRNWTIPFPQLTVHGVTPLADSEQQDGPMQRAA